MNNTQVKQSKIGQHFDIGLYRFLWSIVTFIFVAGVLWQTVVGQVATNSHNISEVGDRLEAHIENLKFADMTAREVVVRVVEHEKEIDALEEEDTRISDLQIKVMANQAILVKNDTRKTIAIEVIQKDIALIKGKLDIK